MKRDGGLQFVTGIVKKKKNTAYIAQVAGGGWVGGGEGDLTSHSPAEA